MKQSGRVYKVSSITEMKEKKRKQSLCDAHDWFYIVRLRDIRRKMVAWDASIASEREKKQRNVKRI